MRGNVTSGFYIVFFIKSDVMSRRRHLLFENHIFRPEVTSSGREFRFEYRSFPAEVIFPLDDIIFGKKSTETLKLSAKCSVHDVTSGPKLRLSKCKQRHRMGTSLRRSEAEMSTDSQHHFWLN